MKTEEAIQEKIKDLKDKLEWAKKDCINNPADDTVGGCFVAVQHYNSFKYATDIFITALEWVLEE